MVTFFKVVGWVMATISGLLVWNILPETRAVISCGMVVAFICYGISIVVGVTVKRLIGDELLELRLQCNAVANRLGPSRLREEESIFIRARILDSIRVWAAQATVAEDLSKMRHRTCAENVKLNR